MKRAAWKKGIGWAALLLCAALAAGCGATPPAVQSAPAESASPAPEETGASEAAELTVSAAASLTDVMNELFTLYQPETKVRFTPNYGASGTLQTQIEEGAPADLFFSAAQKQMDALEEKGLLLEGSRRNLLENKVVLIVPKDSGAALASFADAASDKVKTIALGEPKGVPVGQYSEEIFTSLGLLDQVTPKATYGSDVRQVLNWVGSGDADCGVVYATDAAATDDVTIVCEAPEGSCKPVIYPAAILKDSKNAQAAQAFLDFLATDEAKKVFRKYGFYVLAQS